MMQECFTLYDRDSEIERGKMMFRQSIWLGLLIALMIVSVSIEDDRKEDYIITEDYCSMDEFEELDYYLFCDSQLHQRGSSAGFTFKPSIIGSETKTIEEAKALYQEFSGRLPLDSVEENNVFYVSPDCKWVITNKWSSRKDMSTQVLFYEKEKVREKVTETRGSVFPILIVKDGDSYREMDEEHYEKLLEMENITFYDGGYDDFHKINTDGKLLAGIQDNDSRLTIRRIEDGTEQWIFSLQGIREEVERIRDDVQEKDIVLIKICQFEGDEKGGWLTLQAGCSSFFRIAYPSGEVTYLGEYMYSVCVSPDGKYAAYSSDDDYDSGIDMSEEEHEKMQKICPPGICVKEIETGKTAYIYWNPAKNSEEDYMEYRNFMWIEKAGFEKVMEQRT